MPNDSYYDINTNITYKYPKEIQDDYIQTKDNLLKWCQGDKARAFEYLWDLRFWEKIKDKVTNA